MGLVLHPERHPRFGSSFTIPTDIEVATDADDGEPGYYVTLAIGSEWGETIAGPPNPHHAKDDDARAAVLRETGDTLHRSLEPDEARALAAALWHYADAAERRRMR